MQRPSLVLCLALALGACSASHDPPSDASPPSTDTGPCGTIGAACATDDDCDEGQVCAGVPSDADAGPRPGVCGPTDAERGTCGGWTGTPCPEPTDLCVAPTYVTDIAFCFERDTFACLCRSEIIRDAYDCDTLTR